jgi:phenylacetate-CoA ligase
MNINTLYNRLPSRAQEWALSAYARRLDALYYSGDYPAWVERYQSWERLPAERQRDMQTLALRHILRVACRNVPWFREQAVRNGWSELDIADVADIARLPIMEKDPIRRDPWAFVRDDVPHKRLWLEKTSGTTGTALRIYWPREMLPRWWALHEVRVRHWAGVNQAMPRAMVGGRPIVPGNTVRPPFWRYNRRWRQVYMSSYHIAPDTAGAYIEALRRYRSQWITGYGSAIALLGEYLCEHPAPLHISAALTSGDTVSPAQRRNIEQGFGCRVFDYYGSAEGCCVISECQFGRLHAQPEAGILEIVDGDGQPCPPGVEGEFLCTGLLNDAMPLIRYRTGDYGAWAAEQGCACGRASAVVAHITGRTDDYLELADGRRVGRLSTAMKLAPHVRRAQLAQDEPGHAWLLVVPDAGYRDEDGARLVEDVLSRIGESAIRIDVRPVADIPPTAVGKHVLVRRLMGNPELLDAYRALVERGEDPVAA